MKARLTALADTVRSSLWFLPSVLAALGVGLAVLLLQLDRRARLGGVQAWTYAGGADGAREVMATVATSMIGIAGVAFSVTIVALSVASAQLGPRVLRSFTRDRGNQLVLGTFVATFLFCTLVLRAVRSPQEGEFVPHLAVTAGVVLAVTSLGVLIYFVHHVSVLLQAPHVVAAVADDLEASVRRLLPARVDGAAGGPAPVAPPAAGGVAVGAAASGYVQAVDADELLALATGEDLVLHVLVRPGRFVLRGTALARVWPGAGLTPAVERRVRRAVLLGGRRTTTEDVEYAAHELVEIAVRSLTSSLNDASTATLCVDRLGAVLALAAERDLPPPGRWDADGRLRLVMEAVTHADLVEASFGQIRRSGRGDFLVTRRLLEIIGRLGTHPAPGPLRAALHEEATRVAAGAEAIPDPSERWAVAEEYARASRLLIGPGPGEAAPGEPDPAGARARG
jgi:uncharacterized membrane protein